MHYSNYSKLRADTITIDAAPLYRYVEETKNHLFLKSVFRVVLRILFDNTTLSTFLKECNSYFINFQAPHGGILDLREGDDFLYLYEELETMFDIKTIMLMLLKENSLVNSPAIDVNKYDFFQIAEPKHFILISYSPAFSLNDIPEKF